MDGQRSDVMSYRYRPPDPDPSSVVELASTTSFALSTPTPTTIPYLISRPICAGMVSAVGLATLHHVNMNSPRNLFIVGFSFLMGLALPQYIAANPGIIQTGLPTLDQILTVLIQTSMFLGGLIGFILDNTVPGTPEDRGLKGTQDVVGLNDNNDDDMNEEMKAEVQRLINSCYDMPFGMSYIREWLWTKYIPFSPTFPGFNFTCRYNYKFWKRLPNTIETQV